MQISDKEGSEPSGSYELDKEFKSFKHRVIIIMKTHKTPLKEFTEKLSTKDVPILGLEKPKQSILEDRKEVERKLKKDSFIYINGKKALKE
jgi:hypothetical protein